jgi:hypothetical protein
MRLHNFEIEIFSQQFGRFSRQPEERVYPNAEIRS